MAPPKYFISCDWGTSNFRLRVVQTDSLEVLEEHFTSLGIKSLYYNFTGQDQLDQHAYFSGYLHDQIQLLPLKHRGHLIIVSGMASSNIGLYELDYSEIPFKMDGSSISWKYMKLTNGLRVLLISGIKGPQGMMRGEETQAIGLAAQLGEHNSGILLLPVGYRKRRFGGMGFLLFCRKRKWQVDKN